MAEPVIKHGIYRYKTGELDDTGNPVYNTVYFRSDLESIKIVSFNPLSDLDSIPEIDAETQSALELLQIIEAATRKLDRDKLDKSETATTATPNKLLYLDEHGQLQATVQNSLSLGGVAANKYALKTDIPSVFDDDGHLVSPAGWTIWITDEDPTVIVPDIEDGETTISG